MIDIKLPVQVTSQLATMGREKGLSISGNEMIEAANEFRNTVYLTKSGKPGSLMSFATRLLQEPKFRDAVIDKTLENAAARKAAGKTTVKKNDFAADFEPAAPAAVEDPKFARRCVGGSVVDPLRAYADKRVERCAVNEPQNSNDPNNDMNFRLLLAKKGDWKPDPSDNIERRKPPVAKAGGQPECIFGFVVTDNGATKTRCKELPRANKKDKPDYTKFVVIPD